MFKALLLLSLLLPAVVTAQSGWMEKWSIPVSEDATWDVDQAGNLYLYDKETITKIDTTGKSLLTQSAKSFGRISKIDAASWLKIAVFSEDQQQVCYLDNALAIQPGCIDLSASGVNLAVNFSTSLQSDRIWIYDQLNSELQLITVRTSQKQIVQNLRSLIELGTVKQFFEFQNVLYITDDLGQVATFDNFGTFIGGYTILGTYIQPFSKGLLVLNGKEILAEDPDSEQNASFFSDPASSPPLRFHFTGKVLYVSNSSAITCYSITQ